MIGVKTLTELIGGLGLFLYGMKLMGDGLENSAGDRLKSILEKLTSNRLLAILIGTFVTAVIQSSSATTVMVVSFVNAGLMTLLQAAGVIMGANIGTTITAQLVAFKLDDIAPLVIGIGALLLLTAKNKKSKDLSGIVLGFGLLFLGMGMMSGAMKPLSKEPWFEDVILTLSSNVFLGILAGLALTALVQSSSATTGILIALASSGGITMNLALPVILGCNIGTCVTSIIASLGANRTAKKAALIHVLFNVIGVLIFLPFLTPFIKIIESTDPTNIARQVANAHTIFNVTVTIILVPFASLLVKLVNKLMPGDTPIEQEGAIYLDKSYLNTPLVALGQVKLETARMAHLAKDNFVLAMDTFNDADEKKLNKIYKNEKLINILEKQITSYLVQLSQLELPEEDVKSFASTYHIINDIERIGDHAENIAELALEKSNNKVHFEKEVTEEIKDIFETTLKSLELSIKSYEESNKKYASEVDILERKIDNLEKQYKINNLTRLNESIATPDSSVIFLELIGNLERIGDHANNIAKS